MFFEVLANKPVCQEMLRTILEDEELIVQDVITQNSEKNLYGRSVRLDALCTLGNGEKCNIEIQRSDNDDHLRRVRYNASSITLRNSQIGTKFDKIPEVYVVFISEFDVFKMGKTVEDVEFPELSARMHELKEEEGGITVMSDVMEKYEKIAAEEATQKTTQKAIRNMIKFGVSKEKILSEYTEEEYNKAMEAENVLMV